MRKFIAIALMATASPALATPGLDEALSRVLSIADLCGAVPTAPAKVRGSSVHQPVRRAVTTYIRDTNNWLACATDWYVQIQHLVDGMKDDVQRSTLVAHLNSDFQHHFALVNAETKQLAERVNYRLSWQVRPLRPVVPSSGGGAGSELNIRMNRLKKLTLGANVTQPVYNPSVGLLNWEEIQPLQFKS